MHVEFRRVEVPREVRSLVAFDHKVFPKSDWFPPSYWPELESYWLFVEGRKAGCCAFQLHADIDDSPLRNSLHIVSTAIAVKDRGQGLGSLMKSWQIAYARQHGFTRLVTCSRKSNAAMIALNAKFGFTKLRSMPRYYHEPVESATVMELRLT